MSRPLLLPRHGLALTTDEKPADSARFVDAWRATWPRFPLWARRTLLRLWRSRPEATIAVAPLPASAGGAFARVNGVGILFHPDAVRDLPAEVLQTLIAHELAHLLRKAAGIEADRDAYENDPEAYLDAEEGVEDLLADFGFRDAAIDEWAAANRNRLPWLAALVAREEECASPAREKLEEGTDALLADLGLSR